jgi:hypothetical protein
VLSRKETILPIGNIMIRHCPFHIAEHCKKYWWIEGIIEDCEYEYDLFQKNLSDLLEREKKDGNIT